MTSPIERAAEAICKTRPHDGGGSEIIYEDAVDFARAALEAALDRDELARVVLAHQDVTDRSSRDGCMCGMGDTSKYGSHVADAIRAHALGEEMDS